MKLLEEKEERGDWTWSEWRQMKRYCNGGSTTKMETTEYPAYLLCMLDEAGVLGYFPTNQRVIRKPWQYIIDRPALYTLINESVIGKVFRDEDERQRFYNLAQSPNAAKDFFYDHCYRM